MKALNLYAGIGGNRKHWDNCQVTAVELNPEIAAIYQDFYPNDTVIVGDAHQYLLDHFKEFDFIWSSPPCQSHSRLTLIQVNRGLNKLKYPDMKLYQEIIILQNHFKGKYVIENVKSYYKPLITPQQSGRHYFWSNFTIPKVKTNHISVKNKVGITLNKRMKDVGMIIKDWHGYNKPHKEQLINNCVNPGLANTIFNRARNIQIEENTPQGKIDFKTN